MPLIVIPHEFNVIGGLLGLGPDILLDLLSEMIEIQDAFQLISVCKKLLKLKNHDRYIKIIETFNYPIAIHNPDPYDFYFSDYDRKMKMITKNQTQNNSFSLTQVIEDGVWSFETIFDAFANDGCGGVGIVRDSYIIPTGTNPYSSPHNQHMVVYFGKTAGKGTVCYKGIQTSGNIEFTNNQIVKLEFDSEKGTLIFFVDGVRQPIYIQGIKEKVRFFIFMYFSGSTCTIGSLKRLVTPTSGHIGNEESIEW
ncbi:MAG: hypothetical protein EZS28_004051 [Streblomastix strix]|uniref:SPRY domain-containing protein n=1 Tax=Streblomastix strix TaxID=222440 RepID=A0A5J4X039_9EUKA|nr:MAG: hypothetical protein EZS28_004051 [Streblomastix strix]